LSYKCEASEGKKKREGKRELRNLQSSVNYGDTKASSRCRKDKALMLYGCLPWGFVGCSLGALGSFVGCFLAVFSGSYSSFWDFSWVFVGELWFSLCILPMYLGVSYAFFFQ